MASKYLSALLVVFLCVSPLKGGRNDEEEIEGLFSQWSEIIAELIGVDKFEKVSEIMDNLYENWQGGLEEFEDENSTISTNSTLSIVAELIEKFKLKLKPKKKTALETAVQNWVLGNLLRSIEFLDESAPDIQLFDRLREGLEQPLEAEMVFPYGAFKAMANVFAALTDLATPVGPVYNVIMEDNEMGGRQERKIKDRTDPFGQIMKLSVPFRYLKDLILSAKTDVLAFIKNIWSIKVAISKAVLDKIHAIWDRIKNMIFGGVDLYVDVKKYLFNEILGPLDFIASRFLDRDASEQCMMHHFCLYGAKFLKLKEKYSILAKVVKFFPKQKFPIIFLDDVLKTKDKLTYNPKLATALMYGREKGECKKYPGLECGLGVH